MRPIVVAGLLLVAAMAALGYWGWGRQGAIAAASFGGLSLLIQVAALALVRAVRGAPLERFMLRWGAGMGLRLLGILLLALGAGLAPQLFPALPAAAGFLGVLLPLLLIEARALR